MPLFQNESKCETFYMKMSSAAVLFSCKSKHFHKYGFALRLALNRGTTRKWPNKLLFSGKQKIIQRENYGEATKKILSKVYSDEFEDGQKKYNLMLKKQKEITTKWKRMPFNYFKICFN